MLILITVITKIINVNSKPKPTEGLPSAVTMAERHIKKDAVEFSFYIMHNTTICSRFRIFGNQ